MDDLNSIVVFTKVVETKSFTAAARHLKLSASAVSKHIARLEDSMGVPLFHRSTHQLTLTEYGEALYRRCTRALFELEDAQKIVKGMNLGVQGTLRLHVTPGVGQRLVEPAIVAFMKRHPDLSLELTMSPEIVNPMDHGIDLAIRSGSSDDASMKHSSLAYREFGPLCYQICASPDYIREHGMPKEPADLARHNCLIHLTQVSPRDWRFIGPKGEYSVRVSGNIVSNSHTAIYEAAVAGIGIARFLTYEAGEDRDLARLQLMFGDVTRSDRIIRAFYPRSDHVPEKVRLFLDFLAGRLVKSGHVERASA